MKSNGKKLREVFRMEDIVIAPGAYDAYSARLIEQAGFPVAYMSGGCVAHSLIGQADIGYMTQTEMARSVHNICSVIDIPLVADGDNGYGGPLQVMRTIEEYIKAGAAAIQLEDQVMPKRCGFMKGKELISEADAVAKIRAAAYARDKFDPDFVIIARTDAVAVNGIEDAVHRANAFYEAGADMIYVEAPPTKEIMARITGEVKCPWLMSVYVEGGVTPLLTRKELRELGFKFVIHPAAAIMVVSKCLPEMLKTLYEDGNAEHIRDMMVGFKGVNDILRLDKTRELEMSFKS